MKEVSSLAYRTEAATRQGIHTARAVGEVAELWVSLNAESHSFLNSSVQPNQKLSVDEA